VKLWAHQDRDQFFTDDDASLDIEFPRSYFGYCYYAGNDGPTRLERLEHYATKLMIYHRFKHHNPLIRIGFLSDVEMSSLALVHHRLCVFQPNRRQECQAIQTDFSAQPNKAGITHRQYMLGQAGEEHDSGIAKLDALLPRTESIITEPGTRQGEGEEVADTPGAASSALPAAGASWEQYWQPTWQQQQWESGRRQGGWQQFTWTPKAAPANVPGAVAAAKQANKAKKRAAQKEESCSDNQSRRSQHGYR